MAEYVIKGTKKMRKGLTTGSCAAAAAKAAAKALLSGECADSISITARNGQVFTLQVGETKVVRTVASCSVVKDAGDDPDVTDGVTIIACVSKSDKGITIEGGEGVGRVTKPGLKVSVGKAAINPGPLAMITSEALEVCQEFSYTGGLNIVISVPEGAERAKRTMNNRLGIEGGISILGTTGIVEPMSEAALIDTIKTEIDMRIATGSGELLIIPGNYGFDYAKNSLGYNMEGAVKCSNFIGETLDYAVYKKATHITLIGHAGKLIKLAGGIMDTHSKTADCRMEIIAAHSAAAGCFADTIKEIMDCVTVNGAIDIVKDNGVSEAVWRSVSGKIAFHIKERVKGLIPVRFIVFTQEHGILMDSHTNN